MLENIFAELPPSKEADEWPVLTVFSALFSMFSDYSGIKDFLLLASCFFHGTLVRIVSDKFFGVQNLSQFRSPCFCSYSKQSNVNGGIKWLDRQAKKS